MRRGQQLVRAPQQIRSQSRVTSAQAEVDGADAILSPLI
jgi:hypothetical protein